jgi:nucleoid DNA-binding protein
MNREQLVAKVASSSGHSKKVVSDVLKSFVDVVVSEVKSGVKVSLIGFGSWSRGIFKARTGRNPQTGAVIQIAQKFVPKFHAGKSFKDEVSGK